jgi:hypothetical protein
MMIKEQKIGYVSEAEKLPYMVASGIGILNGAVLGASLSSFTWGF